MYRTEQVLYTVAENKEKAEIRQEENGKDRIMFQSVFENRGNWYKGNLHMHTTRSDGRLHPRDAVEIYRKSGYDFIALTDHRRPSVMIEPGERRDPDDWDKGAGQTAHEMTSSVSKAATENEDGIVDAGRMLILSGVEWDTGGANTKAPGDVLTYHILGIGMTSNQGLNYRENPHPAPQEIVDAIRADGGIAILAHPAWSVMDPKGILNLNGITAAEIYNSVSDLPFNGQRADSSAWFDIWGTNYDRLIPAVASDDAHCYEGDQCYSYTMVNAAELSRDSILDALRAGNFYASQKPVIHEMAIDWERGIVHLEFSEDVMTVVFYSNHIWVPQRVTQVQDGRMDYQVAPGEFFLRAELITRDGRKAWTSPIRVD